MVIGLVLAHVAALDPTRIALGIVRNLTIEPEPERRATYLVGRRCHNPHSWISHARTWLRHELTRPTQSQHLAVMARALLAGIA